MLVPCPCPRPRPSQRHKHTRGICVSAVVWRSAQAIVVNLEHIKAIITKEHVLVVNPEDDRVLRFINDLKASSNTRGSKGSCPLVRLCLRVG